MDPSPLAQQHRPESFQPKIVQLYAELFRDGGEIERSEGFWQEFFLLKPDESALRRIIDTFTADDLLQLQTRTQYFFLQCVCRIKESSTPSNEVALDTLTVFLGAILTKRYAHPSSEIILVLATLTDVDAVLSDLVYALEVLIRKGRTNQIRQKAIRAALSLVAGAYQTGLVSYFTHRDLFPSLMRYVQDLDRSTGEPDPFILLGLLANYNKFEFRNPYRVRLEDFVNEPTITIIARCLGSACLSLRDQYIALQDDSPEGWSVGGTMSYFGLGAWTGSPRPATSPSADPAKSDFSKLPGPEATMLLTLYDFTHANKLFSSTFVIMPSKNKDDAPPISGFLSFASYLFQNAYRSSRATIYSYLSFLTLQILVEDAHLVKQICNNDYKVHVRLCRQKPPLLPISKSKRPVACSILDIIIDTINHNLRRRLDVELYNFCMKILIRLISYLSKARVRLAYHWSELWKTLFSLIRFLTTYASDIKRLLPSSTTSGTSSSVNGSSSRSKASGNTNTNVLIDPLINVIALSLSTSDAFLPDPASYDDLFYKAVEAGDVLLRFRDAYISSNNSSTYSNGNGNVNANLNPHSSLSSTSSSLETLLSVHRHYVALLSAGSNNSAKGKAVPAAPTALSTARKNLSSDEVSKVIKQGYDTLSIEAKEGLDRWEKYREGDRKALMKKITRCAVEDARVLLRMKK